MQAIPSLCHWLYMYHLKLATSILHAGILRREDLNQLAHEGLQVLQGQ